MSIHQHSNQSAPATPSSGNVVDWTDSTIKEWMTTADDGISHVVRSVSSANTSDTVATSADTYLASIKASSALFHAGCTIKFRFVVSKTGAGVAAAIFTVRVGTLGTVSDAAQITFTLGIQTAAIDTGTCDIDLVVRTGGAAGKLAGALYFWHNLTTTGLNAQQMQLIQTTMAGTVDLTTAGLIIGVSCNPGASAVWTFQHAEAQAYNL
jgi:hypothetical protein